MLENHPSFPQWSYSDGDVRVLFLGRGGTPDIDRTAALAAAESAPPAVAAAKQVHGNTVLTGNSGFCGEGDALVTSEPELALSVITADCVPVLLASGDQIAAVHAGWRGLVAGVLSAAVERLGEGRTASPMRAWIGPAIGRCCYEVSNDVAKQIIGASSDAVAIRQDRPKPHIDLQHAAEFQLLRLGIGTIETVTHCTRCHPADLWSYRREGPGAGRNISYIWRRHARLPEPEPEGAS